jgi:hypothetical protein
LPSTDLLKDRVSRCGRFLSLGRPDLLPDRNPSAEKAQNVVVQPQLALELLHHGRLGPHLEDRVGTLTLLLRVVCQPALPPVLDFGDVSAKPLEGLSELREQRGDLLVGRTRIGDQQNFIRPQNESPPWAFEHVVKRLSLPSMFRAGKAINVQKERRPLATRGRR